MAEGEDGGFGGAASVRRSSIAGSRGKAEGGWQRAKTEGRRCYFGGAPSVTRIPSALIVSPIEAMVDAPPRRSKQRALSKIGCGGGKRSRSSEFRVEKPPFQNRARPRVYCVA
nr:hypothetical protein Iba_chr14aCG8980 [Ipomoea batatas]GMD89893.1 hypothetical protein Iba_chr14dCG4420 [Ipomoea batatas]